MPMTRLPLAAVLTLAAASTLTAEPIRCELAQYTPAKGLTAAMAGDLLVVSWQGDRGRELRMRLAVADGRPVIRDLAIRSSASAWASSARTSRPSTTS